MDLFSSEGTHREVNTRRLIDKTKIDNEYRGNKEEYFFFYRFKGTIGM